MKKLPLIFCIYLFIELYCLIRVGASLGAFSTIALFILTSFAGVALIRWQGTATAVNMSRQMAQGMMPKAALINSLSILFAGILLILPGLFTDFLGVGVLIYSMIKSIFVSANGISTTQTSHRHKNSHRYTSSDHKRTDSSGTTIDGEYKREDD